MSYCFVYICIADLTGPITRSPESQTVSEGSSASLFCLHSTSLPAANITWLFNSNLVTSATHPQFAVSSQQLSETRTSSTLFISATRLSDAGTYTCRARNILLPSLFVDSMAAILTVTGKIAHMHTPVYTIIIITHQMFSLNIFVCLLLRLVSKAHGLCCH